MGEYETEEQDPSILICAFQVAYTIGIREYGMLLHGTHDRNVGAHDVDSRVLGRCDPKFEAGKGP